MFNDAGSDEYMIMYCENQYIIAQMISLWRMGQNDKVLCYSGAGPGFKAIKPFCKIIASSLPKGACPDSTAAFYRL